MVILGSMCTCFRECMSVCCTSVCAMCIVGFDQSASIQELPVGTVEDSTITRSCRLEAGKSDLQAVFPTWLHGTKPRP